jgi:hypothetical protein
MSDPAPRDEDGHAAAREVALRIYVELVGRTAEVAGGAVKLAASPDSLAALSVKLAEAFMNAQEPAPARSPDSPFELDVAHFAQWSAESARSARPQSGDDSVDRRG